MRILILEDDPERQIRFRRKMIGHYVIITEFADCAIRLLQEENWDLLCLDHDLGGKVLVDSSTELNTGHAVAKWLEEHPDRQPEQIILHSLNPAGRQNMADCLRFLLKKAHGASQTSVFSRGMN